MDFFTQQITLNINSTLFFVIAGIIILVVVLLIVLIFHNRRSSASPRKKFGFLGKSIYGLLSFCMVFAGLIFAVASLNNDKVFEIQAKKTLQADIITNKLLVDNGKVYVDFKAIPTVDGKVWGSDGSKFNIYWTFLSEQGQSYTYFESGKSNENRSGLQKYFDTGIYKINISIVFENNTYSFTKDTSF